MRTREYAFLMVQSHVRESKTHTTKEDVKGLVGREGLEPPKAKPPDLQSGPFDHFGTDPRTFYYSGKERGNPEKCMG